MRNLPGRLFALISVMSVGVALVVAGLAGAYRSGWRVETTGDGVLFDNRPALVAGNAGAQRAYELQAAKHAGEVAALRDEMAAFSRRWDRGDDGGELLQPEHALDTKARVRELDRLSNEWRRLKSQEPRPPTLPPPVVYGVRYRTLAGCVAVLPVACAALALAGRRRAVVRRRQGRCVACGYDLRATPGRCPECGVAPSSPAALAG